MSGADNIVTILVSIIMAMGAGFGGVGLWIRDLVKKEMADLGAEVRRNSALLVVLNEAHLVRALQNSTTEEMKEVVTTLRRHFEEAKK